MEKNIKPQNIDEYLNSFNPNLKIKLQKLRSVILEAAPQCTEAMSYQMPTFKLNGNLVHFAAYKNHIGFYPSPSAIIAFSKDLEPFELSKGTIRFSINDELPLDLISKIVKFRVIQNMNKASRA